MNTETFMKVIDAITPDPVDRDDHPYNLGKLYFIRTVTFAQTGRLVAVYPNELVLSDAAWIADTGRFSNAMQNNEFAEVEMFDPSKLVIVNRAAIIDVQEIDALPTVTK